MTPAQSAPEPEEIPKPPEGYEAWADAVIDDAHRFAFDDTASRLAATELRALRSRAEKAEARAGEMEALLRSVLEDCDHGQWHDEPRMAYVEPQIDKLDVAAIRRALRPEAEEEKPIEQGDRQ